MRAGCQSRVVAAADHATHVPLPAASARRDDLSNLLLCCKYANWLLNLKKKNDISRTNAAKITVYILLSSFILDNFKDICLNLIFFAKLSIFPTL